MMVRLIIYITTSLTASKFSVISKSSIHVMAIEAVDSSALHTSSGGSVENSLPGITVQFLPPPCGWCKKFKMAAKTLIVLSGQPSKINKGAGYARLNTSYVLFIRYVDLKLHLYLDASIRIRISIIEEV